MLIFYHKQLMLIIMLKSNRHKSTTLMCGPISQYLSQIGRKGGLQSKRLLDSVTAKQMVQLREARRAYRKYHVQCFWSYDPNYLVQNKDIPWVAEQLMKNGDRLIWLKGKKLCP